jgi:hypothetical protein
MKLGKVQQRQTRSGLPAHDMPVRLGPIGRMLIPLVRNLVNPVNRVCIFDLSE